MNGLVVVGVALAQVLAVDLRRQRRLPAEHADGLQRSIASGLAEPSSPHPRIDPLRRIGSGSCARQPGRIARRRRPQGGAEDRRGNDIPNSRPAFGTHVPGILIAGELGGMGLIRKAAEQGRQAMAAIRTRKGQGCDHGVVIVRASGLLPTPLLRRIGTVFDAASDTLRGGRRPAPERFDSPWVRPETRGPHDASPCRTDRPLLPRTGRARLGHDGPLLPPAGALRR